MSAVVVARNIRPKAAASSALDLCLRSALAEPWIDDLVIVDCGNPPEVSSAFKMLQLDRRDVSVIAAGKGVSATGAANLGANAARGRWLLFLDAGTVLQRGAVARMAAAGGGVASPWIVGGRLLDSQGRDRPAVRTGALNTWSAIAEAMDWRGPRPLRRRGARLEPDEALPVAAVSGAFMLIGRHDFTELAGFDERFVADGADLDLCLRAREAGGAVLFQPAAAGVQFLRGAHGARRAQGLARFAAKSAKTPLQKAFALIAPPALAVLVALKDFVAGRPPQPR
ncbi:MAG TPA: glycosyltransferase [Terricaulis sp.]|nr:glycosyltransferase [Terricaulis sp.]